MTSRVPVLPAAACDARTHRIWPDAAAHARFHRARAVRRWRAGLRRLRDAARDVLSSCRILLIELQLARESVESAGDQCADRTGRGADGFRHFPVTESFFAHEQKRAIALTQSL